MMNINLQKRIVKIFSYLDKVLTNEKIRDYYQKRNIEKLRGGLDGIISIHYKKSVVDELASLCDRYGSDKGSTKSSNLTYEWIPHTYTEFYTRIFGHCRDSVKLVFECGIGTNNPSLPSSMGINGRPGASLFVWRDYFPNAYIYGADIDRDILFQDERIKTSYINQLDPKEIELYWSECDVAGFDIMIDDGLHTFEGGSTLFLGSIDRLSDSGIYIIEDVNTQDLLLYKNFFSSMDFDVEFINLHRSTSILNANSMVVVRKLSRQPLKYKTL